MRRIAVSLSKGGVGKTTTAVNVAHGLAISGAKVLLIDTDTQGQASRSLGVVAKTGLAEVLTGDADLKDAIIEARERLDLLAGSQALAGAKQLIARKEFRGEYTLTETLSPLNGYDFVIIDTAPGWDILSINVLFFVDELLTPTSLEVLAVDGLRNFITSIEMIKKHKHIEMKYLLPTFMDGRVAKSSEILSQLKNHFKEIVCDPIHYSVRLSEAPGHGETIFEYSPKCKGAVDYAGLVKRITQ